MSKTSLGMERRRLKSSSLEQPVQVVGYEKESVLATGKFEPDHHHSSVPKCITFCVICSCFQSQNMTATHNKHAWETGKPKHVEISENLGMCLTSFEVNLCNI